MIVALICIGAYLLLLALLLRMNRGLAQINARYSKPPEDS